MSVRLSFCFWLNRVTEHFYVRPSIQIHWTRWIVIIINVYVKQITNMIIVLKTIINIVSGWPISINLGSIMEMILLSTIYEWFFFLFKFVHIEGIITRTLRGRKLWNQHSNHSDSFVFNLKTSPTCWRSFNGIIHLLSE